MTAAGSPLCWHAPHSAGWRIARLHLLGSSPSGCDPCEDWCFCLQPDQKEEGFRDAPVLALTRPPWNCVDGRWLLRFIGRARSELKPRASTRARQGRRPAAEPGRASAQQQHERASTACSLSDYPSQPAYDPYGILLVIPLGRRADSPTGTEASPSAGLCWPFHGLRTFAPSLNTAQARQPAAFSPRPPFPPSLCVSPSELCSAAHTDRSDKTLASRRVLTTPSSSSSSSPPRLVSPQLPVWRRLAAQQSRDHEPQRRALLGHRYPLEPSRIHPRRVRVRPSRSASEGRPMETAILPASVRLHLLEARACATHR
jgi:hypothetical protein